MLEIDTIQGQILQEQEKLRLHQAGDKPLSDEEQEKILRSIIDLLNKRKELGNA